MGREVTSHMQGFYVHSPSVSTQTVMQVHSENPPPNGLTVREKPKTAYWKINFHTSALQYFHTVNHLCFVGYKTRHACNKVVSSSPAPLPASPERALEWLLLEAMEHDSCREWDDRQKVRNTWKPLQGIRNIPNHHRLHPSIFNAFRHQHLHHTLTRGGGSIRKLFCFVTDFFLYGCSNITCRKTECSGGGPA